MPFNAPFLWRTGERTNVKVIRGTATSERMALLLEGRLGREGGGPRGD